MVEGFKDTEVGVIPVDWTEKKLSSVSNIIDSLHQTPSFVKHGIAMVRVTDIKLGNLNLENTVKVSELVYLQFTKNYRPRKDDIVMSRVGSYGIPSYVDTEEPFCMGQNTVVINPEIHSKYIYYSLASSIVRKQIENGSFGSGYKSLSLKNIKELQIPVPTTKAEQTAIASALNDADALIQKLEQLITKKRNIKTGAMQELLKPKEGWVEKAFTEICDLIHGHQFLSSDFVNDSDGIKVVKIGNVQDGNFNIDECDKISKHRLHLFSKYLLKEGDVLMSLTGNIGRVIVVGDIKEPLLQNYRVGKFVPKGIDNKFLAYCLAFPETTKQLSLNSNQTSQANFGKQDFDKIKIQIPTNKKMQEDIAKMLSDIDNEIQELEIQLQKYKMIKQGMMQSLLTGKIRLV